MSETPIAPRQPEIESRGKYFAGLIGQRSRWRGSTCIASEWQTGSGVRAQSKLAHHADIGTTQDPAGHAGGGITPPAPGERPAPTTSRRL